MIAADHLPPEERLRTFALGKVRGIGPRLSGLLIALIGSPAKFDNAAKLWAYAGLHVIDGRCVRRRKGAKSNWNDQLKVTAWKIAQSFVKAGGPYRDLYDRYKARIVERELNKGSIIWKAGGATGEEILDDETGRKEAGVKWKVAHAPDGAVIPPPPKEVPEWSLGRINNMALRYIAKMFLSHLLHVWRELEGLPLRAPYAIEYLGHQTHISPWEFVGDGKAPAATEDATR